MPTLYCDFENGNDNYAGTSFALLAQGTDGRISSTTFSSATASFPNDGSLIGQYLSIFNGTIYAVYNITAWVSSTSLTIAAISGGTGLANQTVDRQFYIGGRWKTLTSGATAVRTIPGDTVRIMGSPAPTSLGQTAVWTSQALQATKTITGATNATPISITCTAHGYSTGDTVVITGISGNTNANGTWEITSTGANTFTLDGSVGNAAYGSGGTVRLRNNTRVMLTSAVTQNIACTGPGRSFWTSANLTNVTATQSTSTTQIKEHNVLDWIQIRTAFTTGKAAYYTLPSTLDLSGYQQVSFWIQIASISISTANSLELRLCSDTLGDTVVNTVSIPSIPASGRWMPITVDLGTPLGTNISSISLYVNIDLSVTTNADVFLNNIIACKASSSPDSLTLTSLIGKNTSGETFWGIQSINGRRVMLDADTNATPTSTSVRGYYGTSETVTTWKRETIKLGPAASNTTTVQTLNESGTEASPTTYSGGWDRTNMSTQNLQTWIDGVNGFGRPLGITSAGQFITIDRISLVRFADNIGDSNNNRYITINNMSISNCAGGSLVNATFNTYAQGTVSLDFVVACSGKGLSLGSGSQNAKWQINGGIFSCGDDAIYFQSGGNLQTMLFSPSALVANNASNALASQGVLPLVYNLRSENNGSGVSSPGADIRLVNALINETTEASFTLSYAGGGIYSHNHDQTTGNHKIFLSGGLISAAVDERKTASGISWKLQPTSTGRNSFWPVTLSLAKVACAANSLVTVKAWMRRDNSGLTMRLVCKGGQIAGVANDVTASVTTTNAWEEETITFTPTETGVVEITAEAWGGTTFSGWVDDLTISQGDDSEALAYIAAVEAADGQALEQGVKNAIVAFVAGCKLDGTWNAIKASCILAGARTLSGALVPLKGTAPTNNNFVSGDYNRKTGLVGDGTSKYLNSNRNNNADPQNNFHLAIWKSDSLTASNPYFIGGNTSGLTSVSAIGQNGIYSNSTVAFATGADTSGAQGFHGTSRISSSNVSFKRPGGIVKTASNTSTTPPTTPHFVYGINNAGTPGFYTASRLAFYSIGESLDLAALDTRVTALINAFSTAIP